MTGNDDKDEARRRLLRVLSFLPIPRPTQTHLRIRWPPMACLTQATAFPSVRGWSRVSMHVELLVLLFLFGTQVRCFEVIVSVRGQRLSEPDLPNACSHNPRATHLPTPAPTARGSEGPGP